jgi:hypothetical protein
VDGESDAEAVLKTLYIGGWWDDNFYLCRGRELVLKKYLCNEIEGMCGQVLPSNELSDMFESFKCLSVLRVLEFVKSVYITELIACAGRNNSGYIELMRFHWLAFD